MQLLVLLAALPLVHLAPLVPLAVAMVMGTTPLGVALMVWVEVPL